MVKGHVHSRRRHNRGRQPIDFHLVFSSAVAVGLSVGLFVCLIVTLNGVTNRNRWTRRPEILHTGTYWSPVAGDQKLSHPDLL